MSKDQIIRDTAYAMWEAEGRPDGQAETHWKRAASQIEAQLATNTASGDGKPQTKTGGAKTSESKISETKTGVASPGAAADQEVAGAGAAKKTRAKKRSATSDTEVTIGGD